VRAVPRLARVRASNQNEVRRVRQRLLEHRGEAIGGDDVEPHARANHDSGSLRIRVPPLRGEEDVELAVGARKTAVRVDRAGRA
jgi:hypothetical protein